MGFASPEPDLFWEDLLTPGLLVINKNGVVTAQSPEVMQMLGSSVVGLDLKAIMSDSLAELHHVFILPSYFQSPNRSSWAHVIGMHVRRKSSLRDAQGNVVHVEVTVGVESFDVSGDYRFVLRVYPIHAPHTTLDFNRRCLLATRLGVRGKNQPRQLSIAILVIDIVNSTEILKASPQASYLHHMALQNAVKDLIVGDYNPLVTLYESVGDSMLFVTLPGDAPALIQRPQCMALANLARDLTKQAASLGIPIRSSASFGETLCTIMDGQVRLFGLPVTRACRLQPYVTPSAGTGVHDGMMVCEAFYQKLLCEIRQTSFKEEPSARKLHCHLKGVGEDVVCRCLDIGTYVGFGRQVS